MAIGNLATHGCKSPIPRAFDCKNVTNVLSQLKSTSPVAKMNNFSGARETTAMNQSKDTFHLSNATLPVLTFVGRSLLCKESIIRSSNCMSVPGAPIRDTTMGGFSSLPVIRDLYGN